MNKTFDLATVLSVVSGHTLTHIENIYKLKNFLINGNLYTIGLITDNEICKNYILEKYPFLTNINIPENLNSWNEKNKFIEEQKNIYGNIFELSPISNSLIEENVDRKIKM